MPLAGTGGHRERDGAVRGQAGRVCARLRYSCGCAHGDGHRSTCESNRRPSPGPSSSAAGRVPAIVGRDTLAGQHSKDLSAEPSILRPPAELNRELAVAGNPAAVMQRITTKLTREPQLVQAPASQDRPHLLPTLLPVDEIQL